MTFPVSTVFPPSRIEKSSSSETVESPKSSGLELTALDERSMARKKNRIISIEMPAQRMRPRCGKMAEKEEKNAKVKNELGGRKPDWIDLDIATNDKRNLGPR